MLAQEIIRRKRDGHTLNTAETQAFVRGLVDGSWSDGQIAALAMAMLLRGMNAAETVDLTLAMTHSGPTLDWGPAHLDGPILDKHSTGGVGDKVSLLLAPIMAACGALVPMISGRGLGHTGGTLDKLESIAGYQCQPDAARLHHALQHAGCAIVGASQALAPADRRLYAIRDVTATVESVALITASILSKKLAAGLQGLVLDVKTGDGAFASTPAQAHTLAESLVTVANGAGLPTRALITDMNQVLGHSCGHALEVREALDFLSGHAREPRLLAVTTALCAELLQLGGLANTAVQAEQQVHAALNSGAALSRFARMVAALGGPADLVEHPTRYLAAAPAQLAVRAPHAGYLSRMATRDIGLLVVTLGGGRRVAGDVIDPRVGLSELLPVGQAVAAGDVLGVVHAATAHAAQDASTALRGLLHLSEAPPPAAPPLITRLPGSPELMSQIGL